MGRSQRQLRAMLRKNWLLKIRHPFATCAEVLGRRAPPQSRLELTRKFTPCKRRLCASFRSDFHHLLSSLLYIRKGMLVEVGKSEISPSFDSILKLLFVNGEHLAFAPDTNKTRLMLDVLSSKFPLLKVPCCDYLLLSLLFSHVRFTRHWKHVPRELWQFMMDGSSMMIARVYKNEVDLENYIRSELYGVNDQVR
ncbi:hypothetical protein BHE74_00023737 [Ensete ventricosum]|nr:hypothetical protein BHE74_00023737 [Ensete ventricosum]